MVANSGNILSIYNIAFLASRAFELAFTPKNILSRFASTGIFPFNGDVFTDINFLGCSITDRAAEPTCDNIDDKALHNKLSTSRSHKTEKDNLKSIDNVISLKALQPFLKTGLRKQLTKQKTWLFEKYYRHPREKRN